MAVFLDHPCNRAHDGYSVQVFDDGLGFRYEFPMQNNLIYFTVKEEKTQFSIQRETLWHIGFSDYDTQRHDYTIFKVSEIKQNMKTVITLMLRRRHFSETGVQTPFCLRQRRTLYKSS